jgi:hypothetical protein
LLHAVRVALLVVALPADAFLRVVLVGAAAAIAADAWWGGLEGMRGRVRVLQRDGMVHRAPEAIAAWIRLAAALGAISLAGAGAWAAYEAWSGGLDATDAYLVTMVAAASVGLVARAYHSGAYALRRIYRPLPSLLAADVVALVVLVGTWPLVGLWAFPLAEALTACVATALTVRYTARTYRILGWPPLGALLRARVRLPPPGALRHAAPAAAAQSMTGLESLLVVAVLVAPGPADVVPLVTLLAVLGPVIRAGYEWGRLLYFDLVRLGVRSVDRLRTRFDRAVSGAGVAIGLTTWLAASTVGTVVLGWDDGGLLLAMAPFLVGRSVLAPAQVRAFTAGSYRWLVWTGAAAVAGSLVAMLALPTAVGRLLALGLIVWLASAILWVAPRAMRHADRVLPLLDWLAALRGTEHPVRVVQVRFDRWTKARGVTAEERRTEAWRRRSVARRIGSRLSASGRATWLGPLELAWFEPASPGRRGTRELAAWCAVMTGGLAAGDPTVSRHVNGRHATQALLEAPLGVRTDAHGDTVAEMVAAFREAFPLGLVVMPEARDPAVIARLDPRGRAMLLRGALRYARDLVAPRDAGHWEISALVSAGSLPAIFAVLRNERRGPRRDWADRVRSWDLADAALGPTRDDRYAVPTSARSGEDSTALAASRPRSHG